jgi:AcrR family transcriptional regulator
MAEPRRPRPSTTEKRHRLLDATEEIMLEDGYAAVSSRSVAARVGINAPLLHYYFPTLDDLFIAVLERRAAPNADRLAAALDSDEPLLTWWKLASDRRGAALMVELLAAANHRPLLKAEVGQVAHRVRKVQVERLATLLDEYGLDRTELPPVLVASAMQGLAFALVQDQSAGYDTGADEASEAMTRFLERLEQARHDTGLTGTE